MQCVLNPTLHVLSLGMHWAQMAACFRERCFRVGEDNATPEKNMHRAYKQHFLYQVLRYIILSYLKVIPKIQTHKHTPTLLTLAWLSQHRKLLCCCIMYPTIKKSLIIMDLLRAPCSFTLHTVYN